MLAIAFILQLIQLISLVQAQFPINTPGIASLTTDADCETVIAGHTFQGTCCSISPVDDGGCQLLVVGGTCTITGPIWERMVTSTSALDCPDSTFDVLRETPTNSTNAPTAAPIVTTVAPTKSPTLTPISEAPTVKSVISAAPTVLDNMATNTSAPTLPSNCTTDDDCTEKFCGTDGNCHSYNCPNFFQYSPVAAFDPETGGELQCFTGETSQVHVANFACFGVTGQLVPVEEGRGILPNRVCNGTANQLNGQIRTVDCVDMDPTATSTGTAFETFLSEVEAIQGNLTCENEEFVPAFVYNAGWTITAVDDDGFSSVVFQGNGVPATLSFDPPTDGPTSEPTASGCFSTRPLFAAVSAFVIVASLL